MDPIRGTRHVRFKPGPDEIIESARAPAGNNATSSRPHDHGEAIKARLLESIKYKPGLKSKLWRAIPALTDRVRFARQLKPMLKEEAVALQVKQFAGDECASETFRDELRNGLYAHLNKQIDVGSGVKNYARAYIDKKYRDAQKPLQFSVTTEDGRLRGALLNSKGTTADSSVIRTEDRRFFDQPLDPAMLMQEQRILGKRISEPVTFTSEWTEKGKRDVVVKLLIAGDSESGEVSINRLLNKRLKRTDGSSGRSSPARVEGKGAWLFMEWAKRGDLAAVLRGIEGAVPDPELRALLKRSLAQQCVSTVSELHGKGKVCHRDIKPQNFVLADSGEVRLIDFGQSTTQPQYVGAESGTDYIGTAGYRAPELGQRKAISWIRADKFSLGVTLWKIAGLGRPDPNGYPNTDTLRGDTLENIAKKLMDSQPEKRPRLSDVLKHPYFGAGILTPHEINEALKDLPQAALP